MRRAVVESGGAYSRVFVHKGAEDGVIEKGFVCWQLEKAFLLPREELPKRERE